MKLTPADDFFYHQIPEPLPNVVTYHDHWRESYFFILHPRTGPGDVVILTMAHYPKRQLMDSLQLGQIGGQHVFGQEGVPLVFDDTREHWVKNQTEETRVVLIIYFNANMPFPVNLYTALRYNLIRRSAEVKIAATPA